ncbi:hypothetical protein LX14_002843 [Williamsia deligens]|nr:hypothetical protein [Williamsia deligens]
MACLWCGVRLVRTPRVKEWLATAVMGAVMVAAHLTMSGGRTHGHAMTHTAATGPALHADAMSTALLLAVAEVVVAVWAIWRLTGPVWPGNGDAGPERHGFQRSRGMPPRI